MKLNISKKITLLIGLPMSVAVLFISIILIDNVKIQQEARDIKILTKYMVNTNNLIHELQKERGISAVYLGSFGDEMAGELRTQKKKTDDQVNAFHTFQEEFTGKQIVEGLRKPLNKSKNKLNNLNKVRSSILSFEMNKHEGIDFYSEIITSFIHSFEDLILLTTHLEIFLPITAFSNLIKAKELAGIERALISSISATDQRITPDELSKWMSVWKGQETLLKNFEFQSSEKVRKIYENSLHGSISNSVQSIRNNILEKSTLGGYDLKGDEVFSAATNRINELKNIEDVQANELIKKSESIYKSAQNYLISTAVVGLVIFGVAIIFGVLLSKSIVVHVNRMMDGMKKLKNNNLMATVKVDTHDEIGIMAQHYNEVVVNIKTAIQGIQTGAMQLSDISDEVARSSEELATGSEQQQAQLSEVATSMAEMSKMILEASRNSTDTKEGVIEASESAEYGQKITKKSIEGMLNVASLVKTASEQISGLEFRSKDVGDVIKVIDDIADQTNLLALNANIEAARAGDAGRGFAVVADEVRKLAERTVNATSQIGDQIKQIQQEIASSVDSINNIAIKSQKGQEMAVEAGDALKLIIKFTNFINESIGQIAISADEQSSGAEEISNNIESVSTVSHEAATSSQKLANSANEINDEVLNLIRQVNAFRIAKIQWTPDLTTGENFIDSQHIELYKRTNAIVTGAENGMSNQGIADAIKFLKDYVVYHFKDEEKYMKKIDYPEYESHKKKHEMFIETVNDYAGRFHLKGDNTELLDSLANMVVDWLNSHIKKVDTKLAEYLS